MPLLKCMFYSHVGEDNISIASACISVRNPSRNYRRLYHNTAGDHIFKNWRWSEKPVSYYFKQ